MNNTFRKVAIVAATGSIALGFSGCLSGGSWLTQLATDATLSAAYEFLWDNDAVIDLFQDDHGTGTTYDDRFTANPSRSEPVGAVIN